MSVIGAEFPGHDQRLPGEVFRLLVIDIPNDPVLSVHALIGPGWRDSAGRRALLAEQLRSIATQLELGAY